MSDRQDITSLLSAHAEGDREALSELFEIVYRELKRLAHYKRARGPRHETLDTTGLVHEAYLKLAGGRGVAGTNRAHFFNVAAQTMRQVLVDYARGRLRDKRGGGEQPGTLDEAQIGTDQDAERIVAIDRALDRLSLDQPRLARVFECRYFAGFTTGETAEALETAPRTVERDWSNAKRWLRSELGAV